MVTIESLNMRKEAVGIVGLGYVGLPLAVKLAAHFKVVGFDLKESRIRELTRGYDRTLEVSDAELKETEISYTSNPEDLSQCGLLIVAVPTPIDEYRIPDLTPLESASVIVGKHMRKGCCVVFESTVFPGATEDVCVPLMEQESGLTLGQDFAVGYSPERINPGDKLHTVETITKIISGSDAKTLDLLEAVYGRVVKAGLHRASSLKVAEAAKVIENTQRDLNIALMNELAMIFDRMGIDTVEVLTAAGTKWNFLPFRPGLVGGHCIGVDPYYLTFKAESMGYHPEMILAGRRINDGMGKFIAEKTVKMLIREGRPVLDAKVVILGITFKENVPDLRNTKVVDIIRELKEYGVEVLVHDPLADPEEAARYYGVSLVQMEEIADVEAVIVAVMHDQYRDMGISGISAMCRSGHPMLIDVKGAFTPQEAAAKNIVYWRL